MQDPRTDATIDRLARPQHGLVALRQGRRNGVTQRQLDRRTDLGSLRRVKRGIYATMGSSPTWEQALMAACLAAGPAALASHRSAAVLWRLLDPPMPVEVVVPYAAAPTRSSEIVHRSTDLREVDAARRNGIPVTNPIRTVGDLGAVAPGLVPSAVERGLYLNLFSIAGLWRLIDDLAKPGRRGLGVLRGALEHRALGDQRTCSPLESMLAGIAVKTGLHLAYQHPVSVDSHRYVLDFALPEIKIAVEADGLEVHATRAALDHDLERQNRLVLAGWLPLRYTYTRLVKARAAVRNELVDLVSQRRSSLL